MRLLKSLLAACALLGTAGAAQQVPIGNGSIVETVAQLKPGEYVWAPEAAPAGPVLVVVNVKTQRTVVFRNGVPIAASTVSTGKPGYSTPKGVFTILQKHVEHYSSTYDNAPMPYMQRLTWRGVALHAGKLPGYPASHGCIRLPAEFAKLLYGVTRVGMTVVVTDTKNAPRVAPQVELIAGGRTASLRNAAIQWHPEKSPEGPVSIIVSAADARAVVIRNGVIIGSAPVTIDGPVAGTWVYALKTGDSNTRQWVRIAAGSSGPESTVSRAEWSRFRAPDAFRKSVAQIIVPGTTVIVTADALDVGEMEPSATLIESEPQ